MRTRDGGLKGTSGGLRCTNIDISIRFNTIFLSLEISHLSKMELVIYLENDCLGFQTLKTSSIIKHVNDMGKFHQCRTDFILSTSMAREWFD